MRWCERAVAGAMRRNCVFEPPIASLAEMSATRGAPSSSLPNVSSREPRSTEKKRRTRWNRESTSSPAAPSTRSVLMGGGPAREFGTDCKGVPGSERRSREQRAGSRVTNSPGGSTWATPRTAIAPKNGSTSWLRRATRRKLLSTSDSPWVTFTNMCNQVDGQSSGNVNYVGGETISYVDSRENGR